MLDLLLSRLHFLHVGDDVFQLMISTTKTRAREGLERTTSFRF